MKLKEEKTIQLFRDIKQNIREYKNTSLSKEYLYITEQSYYQNTKCFN